MPAVGDVVLLRYAVAGPAVYHERILLCVHDVPTSSYGIVSPDFDVYCEEIRGANTDLHSLYMCDGLGGVPAGVPANKIYGFAAPYPTVDELAAFVRDACLQAGCVVPPAPCPVCVTGGALLHPVIAVPGGAMVPAAVPGAVVPPGVGPGGAAIAAAMPGPMVPVIPIGIIPAGAPLAMLRNPLVPAVLVPAPGGWYLDEPLAMYDVGVMVQIPAGAPMLQTRALVMIGNEEAVVKFLSAGVNLQEYIDARTAFLNTDRRIQPCPAYADGALFTNLVQSMVSKPGGLPNPLIGPDTKDWMIDSVATSSASSFVARFHRWRHESGVKPTLPLIYELEVAAQALDSMVMIDRLNIRNLVGADVLLRRIQLIEHAVLECPEAPSFEGARHFMGFGERRGGALIAPTLTAYVAGETGKEVAIIKEKRKAKEAIEAQRVAKGKGGKNGGKGGGAGGAQVVP